MYLPVANRKLFVDDYLWCLEVVKKVLWFGLPSSFKANAYDCDIVTAQHKHRGS